jgi:hypothetical protein
MGGNRRHSKEESFTLRRQGAKEAFEPKGPISSLDLSGLAALRETSAISMPSPASRLPARRRLQLGESGRPTKKSWTRRSASLQWFYQRELFRQELIDVKPRY